MIRILVLMLVACSGAVDNTVMPNITSNVTKPWLFFPCMGFHAGQQRREHHPDSRPNFKMAYDDTLEGLGSVMRKVRGLALFAELLGLKLAATGEPPDSSILSALCACC